MLGIVDAGTYVAALEDLEFKVELPSWLDADLEKRGLIDARHCDQRRTPRFHCCGQGIISAQPSHLGEVFGQERALVVIRDISRTGLGLLTHQQWCPDQPVEILTATACIRGRSVRTRFIGPQCFSTGILITGVTEYPRDDD